jgi:NADPH:quinone reductase-like Zn-dependent oxidoreductase
MGTDKIVSGKHSSVAGDLHGAHALYYVGTRHAIIRDVDNSVQLASQSAPSVLIRTLYSGISRGTERLVFEGRLPPSEWQRMRAPFQEGEFPFPVKYGYAAVGVVVAGPAEMLGRTVFALHPHQDRFQLPANAVLPLPVGVPPLRATLAANMETALNALWDSELKADDTATVIGAGVLGCLIAYLLARQGRAVTLVDIVPDRAAIATSLGVRFASPEEAPKGAQVIFHTSASQAGLCLALNIAGFEARIVEASWYGDHEVALPLGAAFHSQRLRIISSQVGHVAPAFRADTSHRARLAKALTLLDDARLDALITEIIPFDAAPEALSRILAPAAPGLFTAIHYNNP